MGSIKQGNDAEGKVECDPEAMSKKKILNKMNNTKKKKKMIGGTILFRHNLMILAGRSA